MTWVYTKKKEIKKQSQNEYPVYAVGTVQAYWELDF